MRGPSLPTQGGESRWTPRTSTDGDARGLDELRRPRAPGRRVPERSAMPASGERDRDPSELGGDVALPAALA
eukprot:12647546-Alexandrium_andersonii.AAC.1